MAQLIIDTEPAIFSDHELVGAQERIEASLQKLRHDRHVRSRQVMPNLLSPLGELDVRQKAAAIIAGLGILGAGAAYGFAIRDTLKQTPAVVNNSPAYAVPSASEGKLFVAHGESESQIINESYPAVKLYASDEYLKLMNMINRQLPKGDQATHDVPFGQHIELTQEAQIPKSNQS